jgi:hypothetical protein
MGEELKNSLASRIDLKIKVLEYRNTGTSGKLYD